jgi:hypothetical protein
LYRASFYYTYNEQTNAHLIDSLLYRFFIAPARFNANALSSGSSYTLPAKLHKSVHAVLVVFCLRSFHIRYLESLKLSNIKNVLAIINKLYCRDNSREYLYMPGHHSDISTQIVYTAAWKKIP